MTSVCMWCGKITCNNGDRLQVGTGYALQANDKVWRFG